MRRCKTHGKPETAAPELAGPDRWTQPNEICTSGFPLAELQTFDKMHSQQCSTHYLQDDEWQSSVGLKRKTMLT